MQVAQLGGQLKEHCLQSTGQSSQLVVMKQSAQETFEVLGRVKGERLKVVSFEGGFTRLSINLVKSRRIMTSKVTTKGLIFFYAQKVPLGLKVKLQDVVLTL